MGKTRKSITKRLKITKTGKVLRRSTSLNHFLAKKQRSKQTAKKGWSKFSHYKTIKKVITK